MNVEKLRYLPRQTAKAVAEQWANCRNLSLLLDRFNPWALMGRGKWDLAFDIDDRDRRRTASGGEAKGYWLGDGSTPYRIRLLDNPLLSKSRIDTQLLNAHLARRTTLVKARSAATFTLRTQTRLMVGLGTQSVLETNLTLHRVYGYPIIPGSALKGLARTTALFELAAEFEIPGLGPEDSLNREGKTPLALFDALLEMNFEMKRQEAKKQFVKLQEDQKCGDVIKSLSFDDFIARVAAFRVTFGYLSFTGGAVFFDALPNHPPDLVPEIMNPHYPAYYSDSGAPNDADSPNPISFLAVKEGVLFSFAVAPRRRDEDIESVRNAICWLKKGLQEIGIGAKTNAGYGLFGDKAPFRPGKGPKEGQIPSPTPDPKKDETEQVLRESTEHTRDLADDFIAWFNKQREDDDDS